MAQMQLGELLVSAGSITKEQLEEGLRLQKQSKDRIGTVLIENGIITERKLIEVLQMQLGIEFVDLTKVSIPSLHRRHGKGERGSAGQRMGRSDPKRPQDG